MGFFSNIVNSARLSEANSRKEKAVEGAYAAIDSLKEVIAISDQTDVDKIEQLKCSWSPMGYRIVLDFVTGSANVYVKALSCEKKGGVFKDLGDLCSWHYDVDNRAEVYQIVLDILEQEGISGGYAHGQDEVMQTPCQSLGTDFAVSNHIRNPSHEESRSHTFKALDLIVEQIF